MTNKFSLRIIGIVLLVLGTIVPVAVFSTDSAVDEEFFNTITALENRVEELTEEYIDSSMNASTFMIDEDYDKAIESYTKALDQNKSLAGAYEEMRAFLEKNSPAWTAEDAAGFDNIMKEHQQGYVSIFTNRGNCYSLANQDELALKDYAKAIELAPNNGEAYYQRGMYFVKKGEVEKAKADMVKMLEVDPESPIAPMAQMILDMYQ